MGTPRGSFQTYFKIMNTFIWVMFYAAFKKTSLKRRHLALLDGNRHNGARKAGSAYDHPQAAERREIFLKTKDGFTVYVILDCLKIG